MKCELKHSSKGCTLVIMTLLKILQERLWTCQHQYATVDTDGPSNLLTISCVLHLMSSLIMNTKLSISILYNHMQCNNCYHNNYSKSPSHLTHGNLQLFQLNFRTDDESTTQQNIKCLQVHLRILQVHTDTAGTLPAASALMNSAVNCISLNLT